MIDRYDAGQELNKGNTITVSSLEEIDDIKSAFNDYVHPYIVIVSKDETGYTLGFSPEWLNMPEEEKFRIAREWRSKNEDADGVLKR